MEIYRLYKDAGALGRVEKIRLLRESLQPVLRVARNMGLLDQVEWIRYRVAVLRSYRRNATFCRQHPHFAVPPRHLAYEAYSSLDWEFYKTTGEQTAIYLAEAIKKYSAEFTRKPLHILEWGCGPGRVIRHMPVLFGSAGRFYGTDYNRETINWCQENIPEVHFEMNELLPPLGFGNDFFDVVYAISVFTHLSERAGQLWIGELERVTVPGGLIIFTVHGDALKRYLLPDELCRYESYGLVERGHYQEGKKMFSTYHSPKYVSERLLANMQVLEHRTDGFYANIQDVWIARKNQEA